MIKDVVQCVGVLFLIVLCVMYGSKIISKLICDKVIKVVWELNYVLDFNVQNLVIKVSNIIGVVLLVDYYEIFFNLFFLEMIWGINEVCSKNGVMIMLVMGILSDELVYNIDVMIV